MKLYVATDGEYSDYHVVGIFSTYKEAKKYGDVFVTELDIPVQDCQEGSYCCYVATKKCTAYDSAPAHIYKLDKDVEFSKGDVVYEVYCIGTHWETSAHNYGSSGKTKVFYGETKTKARAKAENRVGPLNFYIWDNVAINKDRWGPQKRP